MKQFIKQHKYPLILFILFLVIAILSWSKITNFSRREDGIPLWRDNQIQNPNTNTTTSLNHFTTSSPPDNTKNIQPLSNSTSTSTLITPTLPSQTEVSNLKPTSYNLEATSTSTVYELMKNSQINFKTKTFPGMGYFVEEINGVKNDNQAGKYWIYYVNGESAKLGISTQIVKPNDIITWKYENSNFTN